MADPPLPAPVHRRQHPRSGSSARRRGLAAALGPRPFPAGLRREAVRLHHDREWFLQVLEALPRAFCHLDMWPANLRSDGPAAVALDWAFAGDGALGEDLGNYIPTPSSTSSSRPPGCPSTRRRPTTPMCGVCASPAGTSTSGWYGSRCAPRRSSTTG
ncbi:phosphotransferase [Streptomyces sp. NPDC054804]